jgi:pimeloyl-ACP methyl ester carboxylesterase
MYRKSIVRNRFYGWGMDIILIPGLWLTSDVWADVADELRARGHDPVPVALPGADDGNANATLADQLSAVLAAVDAATGSVTVVGHSAASTMAWLAADRRPERVQRVVMIGGFPVSDGSSYADLFPRADGVMPFPGWDTFEGPDSADLDEPTRARIAATSVAVPEGVALGRVEFGDARRFEIPVVLVCPEFSPDDARAWIERGDVAELAVARHLSYVDIDSGHWPMLTQPAELARLLDTIHDLHEASREQ